MPRAQPDAHEKMARKENVNVHEQERAVAVLAKHRLVTTLHSTLPLLNICTRCATRRPSVIRKSVKPVNKEQECVSKGCVIFSDSPQKQTMEKNDKNSGENDSRTRQNAKNEHAARACTARV